MSLIENFLQSLYTDTRADAKEWQGPNIPYGDDSNRPNLIRECFTLESNKMKINCLRKLRDQAAMNPFYQARLDRFVDAITQTYEPTNQPGTIPGNEFKETAVGEDLTEGKITGHLKGAPAITKWIQTVKMNEGYNRRKVEEYCKKQPRGKRKKCKQIGEVKILQKRLKDLTSFKSGSIGKEFKGGCNNPLLDKQVCQRMFVWEINKTQKQIKKLQVRENKFKETAVGEDLTEGLKHRLPGSKKRAAKRMRDETFKWCRNRYQGPQNRKQLETCLGRAQDSYDRGMKGGVTYYGEDLTESYLHELFGKNKEMEVTKISTSGIACYHQDVEEDNQYLVFYGLRKFGLYDPYHLYLSTKGKDIHKSVNGDSFKIYLSGYTNDQDATVADHKRWGSSCGKYMIKGERKFLKRKLLPSKYTVKFVFSMAALPGKWELEYSDKDTGSITRIS